jgi:glycosyltransferase involved in cell wall biosynthesis
MKLILGVDAIHRPLTGIGRYALELARGLRSHPGISETSYFSMGRWVDWEELLAADAPIDGSANVNPRSIAPSRLPSVRAILARNPVVVRAYQLLTPTIYRWRLRHHARALFHSPNYFLPPHKGASVATIHDLSHVWYPQFHPAARVEFLNRALPDSIQRATYLITDSDYVRREVIERFQWSPERIASIPLGVDAVYRPINADELLPRLAPFGLQAGHYSLFVGTVEPRKNIGTLLTAYARLPDELRRAYPLVICGSSGWNSDDLHQRFESASRDGWLRYLKFVPQGLLPSLYAGARLFVYPSIYEGFGLPPLEALASGVPVLSSNASSLPEVVGESARLLEPMDIDAWVHGISAGLSDDEWYRAAKVVGPEHAKQFTWEKCVAATVKAYESAARFAE